VFAAWPRADGTMARAKARKIQTPMASRTIADFWTCGKIE
jgi:hypothetical protein